MIEYLIPTVLYSDVAGRFGDESGCAGGASTSSRRRREGARSPVPFSTGSSAFRRRTWRAEDGASAPTSKLRRPRCVYHTARQFAVSLTPGSFPRLLVDRTDPVAAARWSLHELQCWPRFAGSLAVDAIRRSSISTFRRKSEPRPKSRVPSRGEVIETVKFRSILALQRAIRVLYTRSFRRKQRPSRFLPRIAVGFVTDS